MKYASTQELTRARQVDNRFDRAIRKAERDGAPFEAGLQHSEFNTAAYVAGLRAGRKLARPS